jgi:putative nucleotidyltransferase with HDIG domain
MTTFTTNPSKEALDAVMRKIQQEPQAVNPTDRYLKNLASLPPAPMLVTELLALFREPDCDIDRVVQLIRYDPSLTAQILRTCNSVYFAGDEPPADIFEAVSRIGFYQVYTLVVSIFGAKTRALKGADQGVNVVELWRHSVAVAVSASEVAGETGQPKAVAFTAGLLHDIGKLVLASVEREPYAILIQRAKDEGMGLSVLERAILGTDHAELGGELMRRWNLPPDVVVGVRHHHELDAAPTYKPLTAAVQVGDMIAHQLFAEDLANTDLMTTSTEAMEALQLTPEDLPRLLAKVEVEMEKVKGMLEI